MITEGGRVALVTGITGQDGSYLAELLLEKGYFVHGMVRRSSSLNTARIEHMRGHERLALHYGDVSDANCVLGIVSRVRPTEVYNLAAQSHVRVSFDMAEYTADVGALGTLRLLDAIRACGLGATTRFYQASTSELYGKVAETPQTENTPFHPRSPYGVAKLYSFWIVKNYREAYGMFACNGILFNHESPRRGRTFVTRKVTRAVADIAAGRAADVALGNLDARRDWGHAADYVHGMWLMLQQAAPDDFVLATGAAHSVREFVEAAFSVAGMAISWRGPRGSLDEVGVDEDGVVRVRIDPVYFRPAEVDLLLGDASKARAALGWAPTVSFSSLVSEMVAADAKNLPHI